jgi:hypothetical protein
MRGIGYDLASLGPGQSTLRDWTGSALGSKAGRDRSPKGRRHRAQPGEGPGLGQAEARTSQRAVSSSRVSTSRAAPAGGEGRTHPEGQSQADVE